MSKVWIGIAAIGFCAHMTAAQCLEDFERIRPPADKFTLLCNPLGVAADGPFVVVGDSCGEVSPDTYGYAQVYRWNEARSRWDYEQRLEPSNGNIFGPGSFASSIDIDQNNIVIGAYNGSFPAYEGFAYFYERDTTTGVWSQIGLVQGSPSAENNNFGFAVAIDGDHALITGMSENNGGIDRGSVYFYTKSGGSWTQTQRIPSPFLDSQVFGWSAAMDGDIAVVGSPKQAGNRAVVYRRENGTWVQEQVLTGDDTSIGDEFGDSVAVSGNTIAVGARLHDGVGGVDAGAIYMFERDPDAMSWSQTQRIEWGIGGGRLTDVPNGNRGLALDGDQMLAVARINRFTQRYRRQDDQWVTSGVIDAETSVAAGGGTIISGDRSDKRMYYADVIRCADIDTDGDGLLDRWEMEGGGYDANLDGVIDLSLYDLGARFDRQDLFYEFDRMLGVPYDEEAIVDVIAAFANAPVSNPDGSTGITLHVDLAGIDVIPFDSEWDALGTEYQVAKDLYWGTPLERVDPNASGILRAKQDVYRYAVIVNDFVGGALGVAETPGNDMAVALGSMEGDRHLQASTIMHEMGHNLNLSHGGVVQDDGGGDASRLGDDLPVPDNTNFKPNYVSVMNYSFDFLTDAFGGKLPVDFSREKIDSLDESSLDETVGMVSTLYDTVWILHGYREPGEQPRVRRVQIGTSSLDWNNDGTVEPNVVTDLNWLGNGYAGADMPTPGEMLDGCNDWDSVVLRFSDTLSYEWLQVIEPTDYEELTVDELAFLRVNIPPPPGLCPADLNDDGALDFFDVSAFLTAYNAMDPVADFNSDGMFNFFDVSAFLSTFNAGCP